MSKRALFISDRVPNVALADWLHVEGYELDVVYSLEAGARVLTHAEHSCAILGPFREDYEGGVELLLSVLLERGTEVMVLADNEQTAAIARKQGAPVRWVGPLNVLH